MLRYGCWLLLLPLSVRADAGFTERVQPFLAKHCLTCHNDRVQKGELRLDTLPATMTTAEQRATWKAVLDRTRAGEMPPAKQPRPTAAELAALTGWIEERLTAHEHARQAKEGRVVLRRLNRLEYENTVRDLLGVPVEVSDLLPEDNRAHGFDTISEALNISSVHLDRYLAAARAALDAGLIKTPKPEATLTKHELLESKNNVALIGKQFRRQANGALAMFQMGRFGAPLPIAENFRSRIPGWYRLRLTVAGIQTKTPIAFALAHSGNAFGIDTDLIAYEDALPDQAKTFEYRVWLGRNHSLQIHATGLGLRTYNDAPTAQGPVEQYQGPGIAVSGIEIDGPLYDTWPLRGQQLLFGTEAVAPKGQEKNKFAKREFVAKEPLADARRLLPGFLTAAFRRPVSADKVQPYLTLVEQQLQSGASYEEAMRAAATAALCSPDFLFLVEAPGWLDDYALASRLAYFLTRTAPDAELLRAAGQQELRTPAGLRRQTERLLTAPTADRFGADFTDGWLDLRNIAFTMPDRVLYPEFDRLLEYSILQETRRFFATVVSEDLPATHFVQSDFALLNERLAKHYQIPGVVGVGFRKVPLKPEYHRGGVLTHASVLKVSANGTSTSPVVRGVYVLERFLGQTPPPPPPGIPAVEPDIRGAKTVREILAKHRATETCASCHRTIDPPGFALESFDVIGGWREKFRVLPEKGPRKFALGLPVDASGEWPDGRKFAGFDEFRQQLLAQPERFVTALAGHLIAFGTGHEVSVADRASVQRLAQENVRQKQGFRALLHALVQSELFRRK
jgi:hypothetical protein